MKRIIFFIMFSLCFVVGLRAQLNEIDLTYQTLNIDEFGRGISLGYYRNISNQSAMGLRVNTNSVFKNRPFYNSKTVSIDLVNRWNLTKKSKFRILVELGASALRRYDDRTTMFFCGTFSPGEQIISMPHVEPEDKWTKSTYLGIVGNIGFDVSISKRFYAGMDLSMAYYYTDAPYFIENQIYPGNLRIRTGVRF